MLVSKALRRGCDPQAFRASVVSLAVMALGTGAFACGTPPPPNDATAPPRTQNRPAVVADGGSTVVVDVPTRCGGGAAEDCEDVAENGRTEEDCDRLVDAINEAKTAMDTGIAPGAELPQLADGFERLAAQLHGMLFDDEAQAALRVDYVALLDRLTDQLRQTAEAIDTGDQEGVLEASTKLAELVAEEAALAERIVTHCSGESPGVARSEPPATPTLAPKGPFPQSKHPAMTNPSRVGGSAPAFFSVRFETTAGDFTLACHRPWAPHGADRFYGLVAIHYFDDVAFFRAVEDFVVQFGIHGDPVVNEAWKGASLAPDVVRESNGEGYVSFAQAGRPAAPGETSDTRSVQLFINLRDNRSLDAMGFAPICRVSQGLNVVQGLYMGYGDRAGRDQARINAEGNDYLRKTYPGLDYIETARLVP